MHSELLRLSATRLAQMIRRREVSSEEVVRVHVARAHASHDHIRAIVADRYDAALDEARACDARIAKEGSDALPRWFGVPCTIKESFALTGMPQTAGLVSRKSFRSRDDAPTVARLRGAGAIPIGVTNTSELCMWMESSNKLYGRSSNPYDAERIVGGSSGGEAAAVGAAAAPFGLGSDIGGSIRMPAFFCGVFGHKPTPGTVPNEGQFPIAHGEGNRLLATGPIARRAEDLWPLLTTLADPGTLSGDPADVSLSGITVLDVVDNGRLRVSDELRTAQQAAARALGRRGARVQPWSNRHFAKSLEIWSVRMKAAGGPTFAELMGDGRGPVRPARELARWAVGRSEHTFPAIALGLIEKLPALTGKGARSFEALADTLRAEVETALGTRGVLLFPSYPRTAPRHNVPLLLPVHWMYTAIFNALELPVTQVPLGLDSKGLPLGVQVVGARGTDALTIAVARALEDELGGWVPPRFPRG